MAYGLVYLGDTIDSSIGRALGNVVALDIVPWSEGQVKHDTSAADGVAATCTLAFI